MARLIAIFVGFGFVGVLALALLFTAIDAVNTPAVERIAAPTMPSVWASNIAEIAPRQNPSHRA